jgi:hypothetical protein
VRHLFGADPGTAPGSFTLRPWLAPLQDYQSKMVIVDGLANKAAQGGTHGPGMASLWTGITVQGNTNFAKGTSIDQAIAAQLNVGTKYRSLEFRARAPEDYEGKDEMMRMIYSGPNAPMDPWESAPSAANELFLGIPAAGGTAPMPTPTANKELAIKQRLFTHVDGELGRLTPRMCSEDKVQLDALRNGFNRLNSQLTSTGSGGALASCARPTVMATRTLQQTSKDMTELLAMSLACDLTRVASLQFSQALSPAVFTWLGHTLDHHNISHQAPQPSQLGATLPALSDPEHPTPAQLAPFAGPIQQLTDIYLWYGAQIANLLKRLSDFGILDQCIICWGSELDNGANHDHFDMPFVLFGGGGGKLRTNQLVKFKLAQPNFPPPLGDPGLRFHNDLLVTLAQLMGVTSITSFGDAALNQGPLTQLIVS